MQGGQGGVHREMDGQAILISILDLGLPGCALPVSSLSYGRYIFGGACLAAPLLGDPRKVLRCPVPRPAVLRGAGRPLRGRHPQLLLLL